MIRLAAREIVTIDGLVGANGENGQNHSTGGASGGSNLDLI